MILEAIINTYYANNARKLREMADKVLVRLKFIDVDKTDFYSLSNEIFFDVINRYDGNRPFDGFLYSCLEKKFKTEMTRRNRIKRQTDKNAISIESHVNNDGLTIGETIADKKTIESEFFEENKDTFSAEMQQYLDRLSTLQREVLNLISIGFTPSEIIGELHINKKMYDDCYQAIHSYRNTSILI